MKTSMMNILNMNNAVEYKLKRLSKVIQNLSRKINMGRKFKKKLWNDSIHERMDLIIIAAYRPY